jgi:hypothetical protein
MGILPVQVVQCFTPISLRVVNSNQPLQPPQPLKPEHQLEEFDSGNPEL